MRILEVIKRATLFSILCSGASAQITDIAITQATLQPSIKRIGVNFTARTFYDSGQITKNLVARNPGFEGEIFQSTVRCVSGTDTTCVDENVYSGWPDGFWNGATAEIFYGRAQGRNETVVSYTAPRGATGGTFTFFVPGTPPALGDYMILRKTIPGNPVAGWWPTTRGAAKISANTSDLPPGTAGRQTVALQAPGSGDSAVLSNYFDSTAGKSFIGLNGNFLLSFKAKGTGGANVVVVSLQRDGKAPYLSQVISLSTEWANYTVPIAVTETGSPIGTVGLALTTQGVDSFLLDDVSLTQTDTDPSNTTAFSDPVISTLRTLNPGILRFWANQLGDTLDNLIAGQYGRQRSGYSAFITEQEDISFGLTEFLQLCQVTGAEPWIVVPITFSTTEAAHLIEYLGGSLATPYGSKRAAAGRIEPWSAAFAKIHLEFGNEAWNGTFKGGVIEYPVPYAQRARTIFAAMRADKSYRPEAFDLILGGQAFFPQRNQEIQNNCDNNDTFALAPYLMNSVDVFTPDETLFGSTYAEAQAFHSPTGTAEGVTGGVMLQNIKLIQSSKHPVPIALYEMNMSTTGGAIPQANLNRYASSLGAGLAVANSMLQQMREGIVLQNLFALSQYQFLRPDRKSVFLWGSVIDMGLTNQRRPQFLAVQMINLAIGSEQNLATDKLQKGNEPTDGAFRRTEMIRTVHSGADPSWNQPLANSVQLDGARYLQSFAFSNGSRKSLIVLNLHRSNSLPVTLSGPFSPVGDVEMSQLTSRSPSDTNEDANVVSITPLPLGTFSPSRPLTLPPNSMTLLQWDVPANGRDQRR